MVSTRRQKKISRKTDIRPRPKPAPAVELKSQHSFEIVRIAISAIIFQVIHFRQAIRGATWATRSFDPTDPNTSYDAFLIGTDAKTVVGGYNWKVPVPGLNQQVDKLLSRLAVGVSDALRKRYLHKVQLSFHEPGSDALTTRNAVESYAMTVSYEGDGAHINTEIRSSQGPEPEKLLVIDAKNRVKEMIDKVLEFLLSSQITSALSAGSRIHMQLEYTEITPEDYEPEAFHPGDDDTKKLLDISSPQTEGLKMVTGIHGISCCLNLPGFREIPSQRVEVPPIASPEPNTVSSNQTSQRDEPQKLRSSSAVSASDGGQTQSQNLARMRLAGHLRVPLASSQDTQPLPLRHSAPNTATAEQRATAPQYTQDVCEELEKCIQNITTQRGDDDLDLDALQDIGIICNCDGDREDGDLIQCGVCQSLQHAECYGYLKDIPRYHFCYSCIRNRFPHVAIDMMQMKVDCLLRRTLYLFQGQQSSSVTVGQLKVHLGCDNENAISVLQNLVSQGHIQQCPTEAWKDMGALEYKYVGDDEVVGREYFEPRKGLFLLFKQPGTDVSDAETTSTDEVASPREVSRRDGAIQRATSFDDGTTQDGFSMGTPATRNTGRRRSGTPHVAHSARQQSNPRTPRYASTTQGTPSPQPSRAKRVAELISQDQPVKRRKASQMSPMVVPAYNF